MDTLEKGAWMLVALAAALDLLTTLAGLSQGAVEANPVARLAFLYGGPALAMSVLKVAAVVVALSARHFIEARPARLSIPAALAMIWLTAAGLNAHAHVLV